MKRLIYLFPVAICVIASGCVQASFTKVIEIRRGPDGSIIETVERESITRPGMVSTRFQPDTVKHSKNDQGPATLQ